MKYQIALVVATLLLTATPAFAQTSYTSTILTEMNQARAQAGLLPLVENAALDRVAQAKVSDEIAYNYFAHISPTFGMSWSLFVKNGYMYRYAGENLAKGFVGNPDGAEAAFMASPTHKANILNTHYKDVGLYYDNSGLLAVEFGTK